MMDAKIRQRLWRVLAFSLVLGAGILAAYYYMVHQPLQQQLSQIEANTHKLRAQVDEQEAPPTEQKPLPQDRLNAACDTFESALQPFDVPYDQDAEIFAVTELARSARLDDHTIQAASDTATPVQKLQQDQMNIQSEGSPQATAHLLSHLYTYGKAGTISALTITVQNEDAPFDANPTFRLSTVIDAYTIEDANQQATARCNELRVK